MPVQSESTTVLSLDPSSDFVNTQFVERLTERALSYLKAGYGVHLRGPAGTGKTTLAMHIAALLGRPAVLMFGDDEFGSSDLVGSKAGYTFRRLTDNYIHSVVKTEEDVRQHWVDHRLTMACREGFTLVYDEFTRSRPEANNVLLSILEERVMALPLAHSEGSYIHVHPNFAAIFTSNPEEYAGVHKTQDALLDRLITIEIDRLDNETEIAITQSKANLSWDEAERIVGIVRDFRELSASAITPTVRSSVMIAKISRIRNSNILAGDEDFRQTCRDVLLSRVGAHGQSLEASKAQTLLDDIMQQV